MVAKEMNTCSDKTTCECPICPLLSNSTQVTDLMMEFCDDHIEVFKRGAQMLLTRKQTECLAALTHMGISKCPMKINQKIIINEPDYTYQISKSGRNKYMISFNCK